MPIGRSCPLMRAVSRVRLASQTLPVHASDVNRARYGVSATWRSERGSSMQTMMVRARTKML